MGKVSCVGRYSVVETIQIKLVGSTLERQPTMFFLLKGQKFDAVVVKFTLCLRYLFMATVDLMSNISKPRCYEQNSASMFVG